MLHSNLLRKLDMQDLLVFVYLYERNSVTQVSEELFVSQSTVSYCLKKLRNCLNDELFVSARQGLPPTEKAVAIYPQVIGILRSVNNCYAGDTVTPVYSKKVFTITAPEYFEFTLLPALLKSFDRRGLPVSLDMHKFGHDIPVEALKGGSIDLVFCFGPNYHRSHPGVRMQPVLEDELMCVMDAATAPASGRVELPEFVERRHVFPTPWSSNTNMVDGWLSELGHKREIVARANSYGAALSLLRDTPFLLVLPQKVANHFASYGGLRCCKGPEGLPSFTLNMAWSDRLDRDPDNTWLREEVLQASRAEPQG